ncbi:hypothetical protein [uncultured Clostridium sp.]|uniref:hypothetical protein n=1 Tax=uncultured Clostridium sp. TaxID=59620 RepID=UPI0025DBA63E|nr:hypothetical protein [uncultured Clostridium sp.]
MMKKKILSLCMVAIMLNFSVESYAYSLNNIQLATNSDSISTPSEGGGTSSGGGGAEQPPSAPPDGSNSGDSAQPPSSSGGSTDTGGAGGSTTTPSTPPENKGSNNVELEGGIGEWGPDKDSSLPNFNGTEGSEKPGVDNEPQKGEYFTISATVPLNMEFLIKNENENGSSPNGKFITPYYKVTNNGSHKLKVHFESFEYATSKATKTSGLVKEDLAPLYVVSQPEKNNGKVEMRLNLTYDRPSNSYLKRINLVPPENSSTITSRLLKSSNSVEQELGELDPNEQARLYYGSDLWESPKSEGITKGVEANFNLKLAFSIDGKTTETNQPSGSPGDTTTESSPSQPPSTPTPSQPSNGTTPGDTSQSSQGSSTQGQQPNGDTSSEAQNPAGNGQQGQRN